MNLARITTKFPGKNKAEIYGRGWPEPSCTLAPLDSFWVRPEVRSVSNRRQWGTPKNTFKYRHG